MDKILYLISAIVFFASCNLDTITNSREEVNNITIVNFSNIGTVSSLDEIELCKNYHRNDTLFLELLFSGNVIAYPYSELQEEYLDSVKNYRVSMIPRWGKKKYIPAIIEPSTAICPVIQDLRQDNRRYVLKSILKDEEGRKAGINDEQPYPYYYLPLYLFGYTKAANNNFLNGEFFFSERMLGAEITSDFFEGGKYSVASDYDGKLQLCQMVYQQEEDIILLRLEDGKTYRYPAAIFYPFENKVKEQVSAAPTPTGNWFPVRLDSRYQSEYSPFALNNDSRVLISGLWKTIKIKDARNYLFSKRMAETMINPNKLFFEKKEMDYQPPKENLNFEKPIYCGFVDEFGQISMDILNYSGRLEGAFYFETELKRYELSGTTMICEENYELNEDNIILYAYRNNEKVGAFKGKWIPGKSFSGIWQPEDSFKHCSFKVTVN